MTTALHTPTLPTPLAERLTTPSTQRAFPWKREAWRRLERHDGVTEALDTLPAAVDRDTTRRAVQAQLDAGNVAGAFVAAMVWGYGTTGYGPARTDWVITGNRERTAPCRADLAEKLSRAVAIARAEGAVAGYRYLNNAGRLSYLGPAFFTKWLYFTTAVDGVDDPTAAPILDQQVISWLRQNAGLELRPWYTDDYASYLQILGAWARPSGASPVQVEREIFGLATGR